MYLKEFIEQFESKMDVKDKLQYYGDEDSCTNVIFALDDDVTISIGVFDDEPETTVFCIHKNKELIVADSMPLSDLIQCFGKV